MNQGDEARLIEALRRSRSADAFGELYRLHNPALFSIAVRITADYHTAGDVVHDTWIRCMERIERFEGRSSFRTWATGILINRIRELWRHDQRGLPDSHGDANADGAGPLPHDIDPIDLETAMARLPRGFREVLILHDVEGFSHEEIGSMLDVVAGTSKSQLARARRKMRELLKWDEE